MLPRLSTGQLANAWWLKISFFLPFFLDPFLDPIYSMLVDYFRDELAFSDFCLTVAAQAKLPWTEPGQSVQGGGNLAPSLLYYIYTLQFT